MLLCNKTVTCPVYGCLCDVLGVFVCKFDIVLCVCCTCTYAHRSSVKAIPHGLCLKLYTFEVLYIELDRCMLEVSSGIESSKEP